MADYIVRKRRDFVFAVEDAPDLTFTLPALSSLGFEDARLVVQADKEEDIVKRGKIIEEFILRHAPGLKDLGVSGMEYFEIYKAYGLAMGKNKLGESQASQDS